MKIELTDNEVAMLLDTMCVVIEMARRGKWPLSKVQPLIALMHKVDDQTLDRHADEGAGSTISACFRPKV